MTVTSIKDAWIEVNKIFPTDYEHDTSRSERAGYPIYYSTAAGVNAWISDLGNRLEVNLPDGQSVNIWIEAPASVEQKNQRGGVEVTHYQSCKWAKNGLRPDELKQLAQKIFAGGTITETFHQTTGTNDPAVTHGEEWATILNGGVCYTVECEGLPIKYWIHMTGFEVSEIIEQIQR